MAEYGISESLESNEVWVSESLRYPLSPTYNAVLSTLRRQFQTCSHLNRSETQPHMTPTILILDLNDSSILMDTNIKSALCKIQPERQDTKENWGRNASPK